MNCSESNLVSCLSKLDEELEISDYPFIFANSQRDTKVILINAVNVLYSILTDLRKRTLAKNELTLENDRLANQVDSLNARIAVKNRALDKEVSRAEDLTKSLSDLTSVKESLERQLKQSKSECQQLVKNLNHQASLHEHEIRRRDVEISQLRDKLRPGIVKRPQTSTLNSIGRQESQTSQIKDKYIQSLIDNVQYVVSENCSLRACLADLHTQALESLKRSSDCSNFLHLSAERVVQECKAVVREAVET